MEYVLLATIGPLSFWYVVHENLGLLRRVWEHPWGKLGYSLLASVIVTGCKVLTDQQIRLLTQSNPSLFPDAQLAITLLNVISMALVVIGGFMLLNVPAQLCKVYLTGFGQPLLSVLDIFRSEIC